MKKKITLPLPQAPASGVKLLAISKDASVLKQKETKSVFQAFEQRNRP